MKLCVIYSFFLGFVSLISFILSLVFMNSSFSLMIEYEILSLNSSLIYYTIYLDWISLLFMSFVFLFFNSDFYSSDYMSSDLNMVRFIYLILLFVLSMMFMIISPNLISILLGWDGLGLISYCLVIYYQNLKAYNSGMITALSNRVGDVALLISIAWMLNYGSWNLLFYLEIMKNDGNMFLVFILIMLAALTKSAQIPFSAWLPAAMAAPTPISALVHSSTLVTAGVYLLIRFSSGFSMGLMLSLLFVCSLTMFMSGLIANFEFDLKKIIALSTLSQLGLMLSILALGDEMLAFFHLLMHALFKALLFMCAGSMIHSLGDLQDIRLMGGLLTYMPLTCIFFNVCNFALCGLPFLTGFYSKDLILEFLSSGYLNIYVYLIFFISTGLTVSYTFRLLFYTLISDFKFFSYYSLNDSHVFILKGMGGLIFFVIISGSGMSWLMFSTPYFICLPLFMKIMVLITIILGIWVGNVFWDFNMVDLSKSLTSLWLMEFLMTMFNLNYLSTLGTIYYYLSYGEAYGDFIDQGWSEYLGSMGLFMTLFMISHKITIFFFNNLKMFLTLLLIWVCFMMF
uniref:NADH-ubiquinone oxidoreductase chain 5 n=1 Tax=Libnetis granicollis TaxID=343789 RepID=A0A0S2MQY3_9COLE|nr:NADH deshydrogenase subunit 5 [Libnetis granicollis]